MKLKERVENNVDVDWRIIFSGIFGNRRKRNRYEKYESETLSYSVNLFERNDINNLY